jgi:hypothetical protein
MRHDEYIDRISGEPPTRKPMTSNMARLQAAKTSGTQQQQAADDELDEKCRTNFCALLLGNFLYNVNS